MYPIADAHCDLLSFLHFNQGKNAHDPQVKCSIPQLQAGMVGLQVLAIYTPTCPESHKHGYNQSLIFKNLPAQEPAFYHCTNPQDLHRFGQNNQIGIVAAIENASGLADENLPLSEAFSNVEKVLTNTQKLLYISLTHHTENRFGGGNYTQIGLKDDGRKLLAYLANKNIAIDFSHASDQLATDILHFADSEKLPFLFMASHSNFRPLHANPRNLPDEITQEILKRGGFIGVNWLKYYLGEEPTKLYEHIEYAFAKGAANQVGLGADFFYDTDQNRAAQTYYPQYSSAAQYPELLNQLAARTLNHAQLQAVAHTNFLAFIRRLWGSKP